MPYGVSLDREEFLRWLGGQLAPPARRVEIGSYRSLSATDVGLIWAERPENTGAAGPTPAMVVNGDVREFLAFVNTYVPTLKPFTAFYRVVNYKHVSELLSEHIRPERDGMIPLVGPVLFEGRAQAGLRSDSLENLSVQACLGTISRTLAVGVTAAMDAAQLTEIAEGWTEARRLLGGDALRLNIQAVIDFWLLVGSSRLRHRATTDHEARMLTEVLREPSVVWSDYLSSQVFDLVLPLPSSQAALSRMGASREERVRAMDAALPELTAEGAVSQRVREVVAGLLAARVAEGSFRYISLLDSVEAKLPAAGLWFSLFACSHPQSDVANFAEGLGRRVARYLQPMSVYSNPEVDVSIAELRMLTTRSGRLERFRTDYASTITVEVYPGIPATFRTPKDWRRADGDVRDTPSVEAISEMRFLVDRLSGVVNSLGGNGNGDLFRDPLTTYRRPRREK